jgi:nucleotide-binding universal stress UspA family protein
VPSLKYASALARRYGAHVTVLHVVPSFEPMTVPSAGLMYPMQSVAEKVLRKAPCAVLLVPPHAAMGTSADVTFRNILCPIDFSPSALPALGFALELAREGKAAVRFCTPLNGFQKKSCERTHTSTSPSIGSMSSKTPLGD